MKKITIFIVIVIALGWAAYFSGMNLSFLGLRSAILSEDNCTTALLETNKAEYEKSLAGIAILNSYITLNTCEIDGKINNMKDNFEVAACQRKLNLRKNKLDFTTGYAACQDSVNAGPRLLSGTVLTDTGSTARTLIEQDDREDMHLNESVYALNFRAQGDAYIKELTYEMTLSATNGNADVNVTKAELSSARTGAYACAQAEAGQTDVTKKVYTITCRAVSDGYQTMVDGNGDFTVNLNLSVSTILATGEGTLKFTGGKFANTPTGTEKPFTRVPNLTPGSLKYIMAYVDPRDLSVDLITQPNTSSTTIPVKAVFNKLINSSSVSLDDFVITGEVTPTNLDCINSTDAENALRTVCSIDLEIDDIKNPATITVDFPAGKAQDKTRGTPKNNLAATQKTISYVFGAPKIHFMCRWDVASACSGEDNTPQLFVSPSVGVVPEWSVVNLYWNDSCSGAPIQTVSVTRDLPMVDLYERNSLGKNEVRVYSAKIWSVCSSGRSSFGKAQYTYTGETIAQVDRLACMSSTTFQYTKFSVWPFVANTTTLCDAGDMVDAKKCNAWQGNATLNPECFPTGQGTLNNPYRICTPEQLQEIDNAPGKHFRLGKSIDLTNASSWFGGKGFQPIGRTLHFGFWGSLDGNGYEIQNLNINNPDKYTGLFGIANGASWPGFWVNNLKLNNTRIQNSDTISGSLAGYAGCAIISGVESTGVNITGAKNVTGWLVGQIGYETKILYSKVAGALSTADSVKSAPEGGGSIGGMIGYAPGSPLEIGYSESNVSMNVKWGNIGGLVGLALGSTKYLEIHDNIIKWSIRAKSNSGAVGAVIGYASNVRAKNNIAQPSGSNKIIAEGNGTVAGIGGFVGQAGSSEFIQNKTSYSIQGNTAGTIGGFGWRIDTSIVSRNVSTGAIGWENSKWPRSYYIWGFLGFGVGGSFTDNYATSDIYLSHDVAARYIGGFTGYAGGVEFKRNYASGNTTANHGGDYEFGGFVGSIAEFNNTLPYTLADNFSTGSYTDTVGLYGTGPDYFGGFIGITTQKPTDRAENNYYANSNNTCTGIASPQKPTCNLVANANVFNDISHGVYTRADNTWDFNNTWKAVSGGLPELR